MMNWIRAAAMSVGLVLGTGCAAGTLEDDPELNALREAAWRTRNGLQTVNGLRSRNGLITVNGLSTTNGLRTRNGLTTINGLRTRNGLTLDSNGLAVDCSGRTAGVNCTGEPDGLLSAATGLMSSDEGIHTASYLIRCALPATKSVRVKDYTGALITLPGELGLAPEWADGDCSSACQEKVSACLMAFTNGDGEHVDIEMAAPFVLGTGHSYEYRYQEASFYGNMFVSPPKAFYCVGKDFAKSGLHITLLETRSCEGYNSKDGDCPYVNAGYCNNAFSLNVLSDNTLTGDEKCSFSGDTAYSCKDNSNTLGLWSTSKSWRYPITTFRRERE